MSTENGKCEHCGGPLILVDEDELRYECLACSVETIVITEDEIQDALAKHFDTIESIRVKPIKL